jgi:UDP-2,4-diacetamido-2,4,6-trideoxy-beta-L-altropyranose hydrolase
MITATFVTAASPQIGGGHVFRCLALAESLEEHGFRPVFAVNKVTVETVGLLRSSPFEIVEVAADRAHLTDAGRDDGVVIFDGYDFDEAIERQWRHASLRVVIDDLANRLHDCEVLVDHTPGRLAAHYAPLVPPGCTVLAGPSFALLRPEFRHLRTQALARRPGATPRRLLVAMGFTDVEGITRRAVEGALQTGLGLEIDVVTGDGAVSLPWLRSMADSLPLNVHVDLDATGMAELMVAADIAIGGGGGTSLERCCMGLPSLVVLLVDNQRLIAENLEQLGAIRILGDLAGVTPANVAAAVTSFVMQERETRECARIAASIVDGNGADKVCHVILAKIS